MLRGNTALTHSFLIFFSFFLSFFLSFLVFWSGVVGRSGERGEGYCFLSFLVVMVGGGDG